MALVERAHGRDEADGRAARRALGQRRAELGDGADDPHARTCASSRVASASASQRGSSSGARSATAARWRATVASSPRAIGPGERAPRRGGPVLDRGADERDEGGAVDARGRGEPLGGGLEGDEEVRGERGGGVVGGAVLVGDVDGRIPRRPASVGGGAAPAAWSRRPRRRRRRVGVRAGERHQRVEGEALVAGEGVEARRAREWPTSGPGRDAPRRRRSRASGTARRTTSAPRGAAPRPSGPATARPAAASAAARWAEAAGADDGARGRAGRGEFRVPVPAWEIPVGRSAVLRVRQVRRFGGDGLIGS